MISTIILALYLEPPDSVTRVTGRVTGRVTVYLIFFIEKYYMFIFFAEEIKEEVNFP